MSINPTGYALGGNPLNSAPSLWSDDVEETTQQSENTSTYSDKNINPQGYNLGGAPTNTAPSLWGEDEKTTWTIEAEATVDDTTGTPDVDVTKSSDPTTKTKTFFFEFTGLKGETGPQGPQGPTPVITMTASQNGTPITVTKTGTDAAPNFDLAFTGGGSSYNGNMAVKYTTSLAEFLTAIYNHADASQQGYPVQMYIFSSNPSGNFVLKNRYLTSDNSYSGANTFDPAVMKAIINFSLAHTPAGGGDVSANGTLWYSGNTSNWDYKYTGDFDLNLNETNIGFRLTGGFMCYNNNDTPKGYYITRQSQNWGEYGPNINTDNVGAFRGIYLIPQS